MKVVGFCFWAPVLMRIRKTRFEIVEWKIVPSFGSDLESSFCHGLNRVFWDGVDQWTRCASMSKFLYGILWWRQIFA